MRWKGGGVNLIHKHAIGSVLIRYHISLSIATHQGSLHRRLRPINALQLHSTQSLARQAIAPTSSKYTTHPEPQVPARSSSSSTKPPISARHPIPSRSTPKAKQQVYHPVPMRYFIASLDAQCRFPLLSIFTSASQIRRSYHCAASSPPRRHKITFHTSSSWARRFSFHHA